MNQRTVTDYISMVATRKLRGLVLVGEAGIGKSYTCQQTLQGLGLVQDKDYFIIKGHMTTTALFNWGSKHPNAIIVFDDCSGLLSNERSVSILKTMGDTTSGVVTYKTLPTIKINKDFLFTGGIIIITNENHIMSDLCEPLRSRFIVQRITMDYIEKLKLIRTVLSNQLTSDELKQCMTYLINNTSPSSELNIRTAHKLIGVCMHLREHPMASFIALVRGVMPSVASREVEAFALARIATEIGASYHVGRLYERFCNDLDVIEANGGLKPSESTFNRVKRDLEASIGYKLKDHKLHMKKLHEVIELSKS